MLSKTLGIVFSNMHDTMMGKLTENRTMASVPFSRWKSNSRSSSS